MTEGQSRRDAEEQVETALQQTDEQPQAWEMIENGRYMPRRIRGSFRGRALG